MGNKNVLTIIAVLLLGIFVILAVQMHEDRKTPGEKISEGISDAADNVGDAVDDAVKGR
ncbi:MAG: hypothetical protein KGQ41_04990 [Alphaproteobacteria bacterium]|nr:hypothetical protein [Alphaproteobacteria bacterium]